jgi:hypothetical protein
LAVPEKLPAEQSTHRSGVELVLSASCVPGLHGCFASQNGWLALSWNLPLGQSAQLGEFNLLEYLSTGQSTHRSGASDVALDSYVPGMHGCLMSQNGWPVPEYLPVGQAVLLPPMQNKLAGHSAFLNSH